ncbi:lytic transglycosylase domain-containing protein [Porphyrobacter sp. GA68]|uniref:lytic transglycosylase domain-containing protein n=1 Tax=Porphyrobacter sp. GA68 TaxID=2883480 RepID=UPI001D185DF0|nr:lytic transglycosylase domain-containing protein [Porphyrobacter sp. GA68]
MSSMDNRKPMQRFRYSTLLAATMLAGSPTIAAEQPTSSPLAATAEEWDRARANLIAQAPGPMRGAIARWEQLIAAENLNFDDYAGFMMAYPGFPQESRLQARAETALGRQAVAPSTLAAFFDRNPPLSNTAHGRYALALAQLGRPEAAAAARTAWLGGRLDAQTEAALLNLHGSRFTPADHVQRMDVLLWQGDAAGARRQLALVPAEAQPAMVARLTMLEGRDAGVSGGGAQAAAARDPGYIYNLARYYRTSGQTAAAAQLLANRANFARPAHDPEAFIGEALRIARSADAGSAIRIAGNVDDLFAPGTDISLASFRLRDDYTSLMWLGGTQALWNMGDGASAAPLFARYGSAAQTPQTRSKGFYWAGRAASRAGQRDQARQYYELAATYPDRFYGMLALRELGQGLPALSQSATGQPTAQQRAIFRDKPLTKAVAEVARDAPWSTGIQFYRAIAAQAETVEDHLLVAELAREIGRRDLAVILADSAASKGLEQFTAQGFPKLETPAGTNWTIVHAITRQESQFADNAISHAGARGLMQLMPGTAREQAGKLGMTYLSADLINSADYNIRLGSGYFSRMLDYYGGSYPLAVAAYNAGPGNVNKWLRANGDPRTGGVDWVDWIERIPFSETRNYVHRVLENAAVYEHLYPDRAKSSGRPRMAGDFLR